MSHDEEKSQDKFKSYTARAVEFFEQATLILIAILTVGAIGMELWAIFERGAIQLADILLIFIYSEVLLMVGIFYTSSQVLIAYPIFIAMTALARLIVLQSKEMAPINILYEAVAICVLAGSIWILAQADQLKLRVEIAGKNKDGKNKDDKKDNKADNKTDE